MRSKRSTEQPARLAAGTRRVGLAELVPDPEIGGSQDAAAFRARDILGHALEELQLTLTFLATMGVQLRREIDDRKAFASRAHSEPPPESRSTRPTPTYS